MSERLKILVVDGDQKAVLALSAALRQQGWDVVPASDAATAAALARQTRVDAALVNARLAAGGGMTVLKRMRASVYTAVAPVLMIGDDPAARQQEFLAAGAQEYLQAPLDSAALCAALRRHLAAPERQAEAPAEVLQHPLRMAALKASGLLDSAPEAAFDRVTRLVTRLLDAPTALLSLVDKDRQFFKSQVGLAEPWATARQTPLSHSFCQWVVCGSEPVTVSDAREHTVLRHNLAIRDLGVIAYAGVPVRTVQGEALGSLCAIDARPRAWSEQDLANMQALAKLAENCAAQAQLLRQPPTCAAELDPYVEAAGSAIGGALALLRRDDAGLTGEDRELLYTVIDECSQHLVQLNRLIQVNQVLG